LASWLLPLMLSASSAARVPSASTIGTDLLLRVAASCDLAAGFRVVNSSAVSAVALTQPGSSGETPLEAATSAGCGQLVALIMLHPDFDLSTVRKERQRKDLAAYAMKRGGDLRPKRVRWAIMVVHGIRKGKVEGEELKWSVKGAVSDFVWFLPEPGEWMPPATLEEIGLGGEMRPEFPEAVISSNTLPDQSLVSIGKAVARIVDLRKMWGLMIAHVQSPEGSERRAHVERHIRSIGWALFFNYGRGALGNVVECLGKLAVGPINVPDWEDEKHDHIRARGLDVLDEYRHMGHVLAAVWNRTGDWVVAG